MKPMRVVQLLLAEAPAYERKLQPLDRAAVAGVETWIVENDTALLAGGNERVPLPALLGGRTSRPADLFHVYGPPHLPRAFGNAAAPYVAAGVPRRGILPWRKGRQPAHSGLPFGDEPLPEAVDDSWFAAGRETRSGSHGTYRLGSIRRRGTGALKELVEARIARFRSDITWLELDSVDPAAMAELDLWIDPARSDDDLDGMTAEALVSGIAVVATRTAVNTARLDSGRSGFLVPPDANEIAHAIVTALFKTEIAEPRLRHAEGRRDRFRAARRGARLRSLYESITR
jgi:hypothetical protein